MNEPRPNVTRAGEEWLLTRRRRIFARWIKPSGAVLEFGPRDLWNLESMDCREKHCCFPRLERAALQQKGIQITETAADLKEAFADLAICFNSLEYQTEPREIIADLKRALKPGGIISIHALYDSEFRKPRPGRVAEHYFSWNVQTLGNLLVDCGFTFLAGGVHRCPREEKVAAGAGNLAFAALISQIFDPFQQVHAVARNSP